MYFSWRSKCGLIRFNLELKRYANCELFKRSPSLTMAIGHNWAVLIR